MILQFQSKISKVTIEEHQHVLSSGERKTIKVTLKCNKPICDDSLKSILIINSFEEHNHKMGYVNWEEELSIKAVAIDDLYEPFDIEITRSGIDFFILLVFCNCRYGIECFSS